MKPDAKPAAPSDDRADDRADDAAIPVAGLALLVTLWLLWGFSWPAMRLVFLEFPVWPFRAVTCTVAGVVLLGMALLGAKRWRVPVPLWGALALGALFNITGWHILIGYGLAEIGAGHGAIVCYTMPVWTAILSPLLLDERMTVRKAVALVLGLTGVLVLMSANFDSLGGSPLGVAFVLGAAVSWAVGTIIVKRVAWPVDMSALAGWQLLIGVVPIILVAGLGVGLEFGPLSTDALLAAAYILFLGLIAGYWLWFRIVDLMPATVAAIGSLMIPVIGVSAGALVLGEPVGWREGVALLLVLAAIALVILAPARAAGRAQKKRAAEAAR